MLQELVDKRVTLIAEVRKDWALIEERRKKEGRFSTEAEVEKFNKGMDEAAAIQKQVDELQSDEARSKRLADAEAALEKSAGRRTQPDQPRGKAGRHDPGAAESRERAAIQLSGRPNETRNFVPSGPTDTDEYRKAFCTALHRPIESRALQTDVDTGGGYLAPQQWQAELIRDLDNLVHMRRICRVLPATMTAESLGVPSLDNAPADPTWTAELSTGSADTTMSFGKRELHPHPAAQRLKVSKKLLRTAVLSPDVIVREELAKKMAIVHENGFMNGNGALQPLGIFTANANGITTSQDVSTGNTITAFTFDGLRNCKYNLPAQWRQRGTWLFHRDAILLLSNIKDGDGHPIWQPSVLASEPDRLLGHPVIESEYAPNTFTTGLYVGIFGDFDRYWIVDALTMTIQVLLELYAETNENGYISRAESDGMPVSSAAFRRVTLA